MSIMSFFKNLFKRKQSTESTIEASMPERYIPQYELRTPEEHAAIRARIKVNPKDCDHTKGGKIKSKSMIANPDYNVSRHIFADRTERIRCNRCGQKWVPGKPGWEDAMRMVAESTNRQSTSERSRYSSAEIKKMRKKNDANPLER